MRSKINAQPNQSLIDGVATLQALAVATEPVGCRPLARKLGLDPTRVNRLLKTLAYLGVARQTADRKYTAGPGMHVLAAQALFASGLIGRAMPVLEEMRRYGHTIALGVLWKTDVSYLYHAPPGVSSSQALGRIGVLPASTSGIGVALLAELSDEEIAEAYGSHPIDGYADLSALLTSIAEVRTAGYARVLVNAEREQHTVAVAIGDPVHAAIGLSGWIPEAATDDLVLALRQASAAIGG